MKTLLILLLAILCAPAVLGQDKIFKKDKSIISCKVKEVGLDEVKYQELDIPDGPTISIAVEEIIKVELSNGRIIEFKDPLTDPNSYVDNKKSALKFNFFSPLFEHIAFAYEKSIKPGRSFESEFGLIGVGIELNEPNNSAGAYISAGYKFMRTPDFYSRRYKYAHLLKGSYIKPQVLLSLYHNEYETYSYFYNQNVKGEQDIVAGAIIINIGRQIIYDNFFLIDFSLGLGYGFSSQAYVDNNDFYKWRANHYGFILGDHSTPLALAGRVKIGILLK